MHGPFPCTRMAPRYYNFLCRRCSIRIDGEYQCYCYCTGCRVLPVWDPEVNWHIQRHDGDNEGKEHRQDFKKEEEQSVTIFYDHEGPHRSRAGRAAMMRNVYNDTKTPSRVRGWIQQELNRGCNFSNMRLPPGCALAHQRGCEAPKGFDYSFTTLVDKLCHKLQHKYDRV